MILWMGVSEFNSETPVFFHTRRQGIMRQKIQEELKQEVIKKIYQEFTDYRSNLRNESSMKL